MGDPVAADPWLRIVGRRSSGCDQGRDEPVASQFLAALDRDRIGSRRRVVILLLRGCRVGPFDTS